jgi:hypothetical protein
MKNMNILTEIDTKQMNFCLKFTNKLYIDLYASVPLRRFISLSVFYTTLAALAAYSYSPVMRSMGVHHILNIFYYFHLL